MSEAQLLGMESNPLEGIRGFKSKAKLHKPIDDVGALLEEIKYYNKDLFVCCLLTYGCLLRPHQEIRLLTWGDFSEDLSYIHLSGSRNKSGKNIPISRWKRGRGYRGNNPLRKRSRHRMF